MIPFEDAYRIVMENARPTQSESVSLWESMNRVLAEEVAADADYPPFDRACMDGFACRRSDIGETLEIVETVVAGVPPRLPIGPGQCARIMTGAMIPTGADTVFMVEESHSLPDETVRFVGSRTDANISPKGEDLTLGDPVLAPGTLISPQHIALMAQVGCTSPLVAKRPRVAILATGSELIEPAGIPGPGQIRNSNSPQLAAQVERAGGSWSYCGICRDDTEVLESSIRKAMSESDIVILSGGVSMGDFDLVPDVLSKAGVDILFDSVAIKPGKPTTFGVHEQCVCFGLPGNPVSSYVAFEIFARPFILGCMGCLDKGAWLPAVTASRIGRRKAERMDWIPVAFGPQGSVSPVEYHGSAHVFSLTRADALLPMPVGVRTFEAGRQVYVRPL